MFTFTDASFIFGVFSNLLALYLVCTKSRKEMFEYRKLLIIFLVTDLFFTSIQELSKPTVVIVGDIFLVYSTGSEKNKFLLGVYCGSISLSFLIFAFHFVFRALSISSKSHFVARLDLKKITIICSAILFELVFYTYFMFTRLNYEEWHEPAIRSYFLSIGIPFPNDPYNEIMLFRAFNQDGSINEFNLITIFLGVAVTGISFTAISISSFFVRSTLRHTNARSEASRQLHRMLFLSLVVQLSIPCCFLYFPCFTFLMMPYFVPPWLVTPPWILRSLCSLYPFLDPLAIILFITDYRRGVIEMLRVITCSKGVTTVDVSVI